MTLKSVSRNTLNIANIVERSKEKPCLNCRHHIPKNKRKTNKATGTKIACQVYGYPEEKLPEECSKQEKED